MARFQVFLFMDDKGGGGGGKWCWIFSRLLLLFKAKEEIIYKTQCQT